MTQVHHDNLPSRDDEDQQKPVSVPEPEPTPPPRCDSDDEDEEEGTWSNDEDEDDKQAEARRTAVNARWKAQLALKALEPKPLVKIPDDCWSVKPREPTQKELQAYEEMIKSLKLPLVRSRIARFIKQFVKEDLDFGGAVAQGDEVDNYHNDKYSGGSQEAWNAIQTHKRTIARRIGQLQGAGVVIASCLPADEIDRAFVHSGFPAFFTSARR
jgi:hypothetical protein